MTKRYKTKEHKKIAAERIVILLKEAKEAFPKKIANRYVQLARELGMKYNLPLTSAQKKQFCSKCHHYLVPSRNLRIRIRNHKMIYTCLECKHYMRFPYCKK